MEDVRGERSESKVFRTDPSAERLGAETTWEFA